jgi:hypothetical protein
MASRVAASLLLLGSRVSAGVVMPGEYEAVLAKLAKGNAEGNHSVSQDAFCVPYPMGF